MAIEKRGSTTENDIRTLVKMADERERTLAIDVNILPDEKQALVVVATGDRAKLLKEIVEDLS